MQVQVNTDNHIQGSAGLTSQVLAVVENALGRFGDRITRVEVQFNDMNSSKKSGGRDKRCAIEARIAGLDPITVTEVGSSVQQVLEGAAHKLQKTLDRTLGRRDDVKGRTSFAGDQTI